MLTWDSMEFSHYSLDIAYRFRFGRALLIVLGPFFMGYTVHFYLLGFLVPAGLMLYASLAILGCLVLVATDKGRTLLARRYMLFLLLGIAAPLILHDIAMIELYHRFDYIFWLFIYPLLTFFLVGEKIGFPIMLLIFLGFVALLASPGNSTFAAMDIPNMKAQFLISYAVIIAISAFYERTRRVTQERFQASQASLERSNAALADASAEAQRLADVADRANRSKSEFLATMSHELRTPLNHIIGFTDLVLDESVGPITASQREYLQDVASSGQHLLSLINEILDFSKAEVGMIALRPLDIDLKSFLSRCALMVKEKALLHSIDLRIVLGNAPALIFGDERRLRQVMHNLLTNALKSTPNGGAVTIRAMAVDEERSAAAVELVVADSGVGLDAADLERIFIPFEQVRSAGELTEGSGLGLSLSRHLVELHGGRIWAESGGKGTGSAFHLLLPCASAV